jgi:hypothetical protein
LSLRCVVSPSLLIHGRVELDHVGGHARAPAKPHESGVLLVFLSHRIIYKRTDANCSLHPRVFQGIEYTGK